MMNLVISTIFLGVTAVSASDAIFCESLMYKATDAWKDECKAQPQWGCGDPDAWCQASCNQFLGFFPTVCPANKCECRNPKEEPTKNYCESPRKCEGNEYEAVPGTSVAAYDPQWCNNVCRMNYCPCTLCRCSGCPAGTKETVLAFDDVNLPGTTMKLPIYQGISLGENAYVMNTSKYQPSGYVNGVVTPKNVIYNGWARNLVLSANGGSITVLGASMTAAWNNDLQFTAVAYDTNGQVIGKYTRTLNTSGPVTDDFDLPTAARVEIMTAGGKDDPRYSGSGTHIAIDNLRVCLPQVEP